MAIGAFAAAIATGSALPSEPQNEDRNWKRASSALGTALAEHRGPFQPYGRDGRRRQSTRAGAEADLVQIPVELSL